MVEELLSVASEGCREWLALAVCGLGESCSWYELLRYFRWSRGSKVVALLSSLTGLFWRPRLRLRTAALPSAIINLASGVEQPNASTKGTELLLFL
jgi:hypothetical protein